MSTVPRQRWNGCATKRSGQTSPSCAADRSVRSAGSTPDACNIQPRPHAPPAGVCAAQRWQHRSPNASGQYRIASHRIASHRMVWQGIGSSPPADSASRAAKQTDLLCVRCCPLSAEGSFAHLHVCFGRRTRSQQRSQRAQHFCDKPVQPLTGTVGLCCEPYHRSEQAACKCAQRQLKAAEAIRQWLLGSGTVWRRARLVRAVIRCARM